MNNQPGLGNIIINKDEGMAHNFDIFSQVTVERAMKRSFEQQYLPTSFNGSEGPFEFYIPPSNEYIFFPLTRLYIKARIKKADNSLLVAADEMSVENLFPQSLFKQVDVIIGDVNTSSQDQLYPYKSYFETVLSYGSGNCEGLGSHLGGCSHFYPDDPGNFDGNNNSGYTARKPLIANSKTFDFCIPLHADIMQSARVLPPNVPVKITLTRNPDNFSLHTNTADLNMQIELKALKLYIRKIEGDHFVTKEHESKLLKEPAIFPYTRCVMKKFLISQNSTNANINNIFQDHLPRQLIFGMIDQQRVDGRKNLSPFYFEPFNVHYINLKINGQNCPPIPYQPDFHNNLISRELRALYDNIGVHTGDTNISISREAFKEGMTFFAYDLTPDLCNGWHIHDIPGRTLDLELQFREPLAAPINLIVYASFETSFVIDKDRKVNTWF